MGAHELITLIKPGGVLMDVKSLLDPGDIPSSIHYWSL